MAYIAFANGERKNLPTVPDIEEARKIVGGYVEVVHPALAPDVVLLVDDEGRLKTNKLNEHASHMYGGVIAGDVVVLTRKEARGKYI